HIRAAEHLIYWSGRQGIPLSGFDNNFVKHFDHHLNRCKCPGFGHSHRLELINGACLFMEFLRDIGEIASSVAESTVQDPALLVAFSEWMRQQRGTCSATLCYYSLSIRDLLKQVPDREAVVAEGSTAGTASRS